MRIQPRRRLRVQDLHRYPVVVHALATRARVVCQTAGALLPSQRLHADNQRRRRTDSSCRCDSGALARVFAPLGRFTNRTARGVATQTYYSWQWRRGSLRTTGRSKDSTAAGGPDMTCRSSTVVARPGSRTEPEMTVHRDCLRCTYVHGTNG